MLDRHDEFVVTPEAVALSVDFAGLGSRMIAILLDSVIQGVAVFAVFMAGFAAGVDQTAAQVVVGIVVFSIVWGYFPLWEILWAGRTPGKRAQHLRVVRSDGQPAGVASILVRNILRIVDFLPGFYAFGAIVMLVTRRSQRLGDLAAATIVVHDRPPPVPVAMPALSTKILADTAGLTQRDYVVVRDFLQRRASLAADVRASLAAQIARALRSRVPGEVPGSDETFLETIAASFRERFGGL